MSLVFRAFLLAGIFSSGGALGSVWLKKNYAQMLPVTLCGMLLAVYPFYLLDALKAGLVAVLALAALCYAAAAYGVVRKRNVAAAASLFFSGGFWAFLLLALLYQYATKDTLVWFWDSLRLWGAEVKYMYYYNANVLRPDSLIWTNMQSYFPGVQLFQYLCLKILGEFRESWLALGYALFAGGVMLGTADKLKAKQLCGWVGCALLIFLVPLTCYNGNADCATYYRSLYIDAMLGILFGASIVYAFAAKLGDWFDWLRFSMVVVCLCLMKDSGLLLGILAIAIFLVLQLQAVRHAPPPEEGRASALPPATGRRVWLSAGITAGAVALYYGSWKCRIALAGISSSHEDNLLARLTQGFGAEQQAVLAAFGKALVQWWIVPPNFSLFPVYTAVGFLALFCGVGALFYAIVQKEWRRRFLTVFCAMLGANVLYLIGLLGLYLYSFAMTELPSFARYTCTILLADAVFAALMAAYIVSHALYTSAKAVLSTFLCLVVCMSFCFSYQKESTFGGYDPYAAIAQSAICTEDLLDVTYADGARVNVLMAQTADGYLEHPLQHRIYFDLIDDNIRVDAFMYSEEDSVADSKARCEALCATLRASYDYLYVYEWDDWFAATYSSLFENGRQDLEDGWKIYHVVWQPDGSLKLVHALSGGK